MQRCWQRASPPPVVAADDWAVSGCAVVPVVLDFDPPQPLATRATATAAKATVVNFSDLTRT